MPPLTPVTPSVGHPSLEDCQEAWLDEIMPDIALDHGLNGTRAGLALWRCPVDDCEHIISEGTPILCALH